METGYSHFMTASQPELEGQSTMSNRLMSNDANRYFRLGFHSIDKALIQPGIIELAKAFDGLR
ncbi:hypothetical protein JCM19239_3174 [Vibrio variabilis]|uniref:Uncharacterized protein n=1 Tax=Vibrio variabilis TaxID=990271 RepID=A0ABQ0JQ05_9VIBR|nr:hypothetical protein JCM19239_3174 [Vibrio variabilis]